MRRTVTCMRLKHNGVEYLKGDVIEVDIAKYPLLTEVTDAIVEVKQEVVIPEKVVKSKTTKPKTKKKAKK